MARFKLDELDHQILHMLIENARIPFTDIAKALDVSAGTVHVRVRKMEESNLIKGSTLSVDYQMLGCDFTAFVGIHLEKNHQAKFVLERLLNIPYVMEAHVVSGAYNIFCKVKAKNLLHTKDIIYSIDDIQGVLRTETMISMEETFNDKRRLMHTIFENMK